ncbi:hypothetical protein BDP27DRAFT_1406085 [Rhodocollybia butyracea]|uniref:Uncharacterized protein n=1 Tax=Rhodocollybia butyracea TaxID=206335 RepID=A0A9P5PG49_9AGAR|nr:hypothetical protein BDP27DRAFT_1406085 [Rhodocollybia butyracea]
MVSAGDGKGLQQVFGVQVAAYPLIISKEASGSLEILPGTVILLLSDAIVVWRAWVLSSHNKSWKVILVFLMAVNIVINVMDCIVQTRLRLNPLNNIYGLPRPRMWFFGLLDWLSVVTSLALNAVATLLIGSHRKTMKEAAIYRQTYVLKVLALLIESGAIFCVVQIIYLVDFFISNGIGFRPSINNDVDIKYPLVAMLFPSSQGIIGFIVAWGIAFYPGSVAILIHKLQSPVLETVHYMETMDNSTPGA